MSQAKAHVEFIRHLILSDRSKAQEMTLSAMAEGKIEMGDALSLQSEISAQAVKEREQQLAAQVITKAKPSDKPIVMTVEEFKGSSYVKIEGMGGRWLSKPARQWRRFLLELPALIERIESAGELENDKLVKSSAAALVKALESAK